MSEEQLKNIFVDQLRKPGEANLEQKSTFLCVLTFFLNASRTKTPTRVCSTHTCVCAWMCMCCKHSFSFYYGTGISGCFPCLSVTTVLSHLLGFLARSRPRGPSLSTGPSMCSEAESTQRWWRWKMWKMEQVCFCPAVLTLENVYMSIHATLRGHSLKLLCIPDVMQLYFPNWWFIHFKSL